MSSDLFPGKGTHLIINEEYLDWLGDQLRVVRHHFDDEMADHTPEYMIGALREEGWEYTKDKFGEKAYAKKPYREGELRVTVVLTKQNELRLDIREWFEPEGKK